MPGMRVVNGFITRSLAPKPTRLGARTVGDAARRNLSRSARENARRPVEDSAPEQDLDRWLDAVELVAGRWVPWLSWALLFRDLLRIMDNWSAVKYPGWTEVCRIGSGEAVGYSAGCRNTGFKFAELTSELKGGPRNYVGVWHIDEISNREVWGSLTYFYVEAHLTKVGDPSVVSNPVPDLGYYWGPKFAPVWVDPFTVNRPGLPQLDPAPPPYEAIPLRRSHPERVEQTERGYYARDRYAPFTRPVEFYDFSPAADPLGSAVFRTANGTAGSSYAQTIRNGQLGPTIEAPPGSRPIGDNSGSPADRPHPTDQPPEGGKQKERKHKLSIGGSPANLVGAVTESLDLLDVLYRSLPARRNRTKRGCKIKKIGVTKKAKLVWDHFDEVDMTKFAVNFTANQIQDLVFGKFGRGAAVGAHRMGLGHGAQFGTSQNRKALGDVDSEIAKVAEKGNKPDRSACIEEGF